MPESLLVVGGGYIGLEMGTVYAALGSRVSVVELTDGLLPGVDRDLVRPLQKRLEQRFAAIHLNTKVVALTDKKDAIEADLRGRRRAEGQPFSRVLVSVGRRPNSDGLGLENTKVRGRPAGDSSSSIRSGARPTRTSWPSATWPASRCWPTRQRTRARWRPRPWPATPAVFEPRAIPAVVFTDPEIAWAGLTETEAKQQAAASKSAQFPWAASGRAQSVGRTEGLTKWLVDPRAASCWAAASSAPARATLISEAVLADRNGRHRPRPRRDDPSASHA